MANPSNSALIPSGIKARVSRRAGFALAIILPVLVAVVVLGTGAAYFLFRTKETAFVTISDHEARQKQERITRSMPGEFASSLKASLERGSSLELSGALLSLFEQDTVIGSREDNTVIRTLSNATASVDLLNHTGSTPANPRSDLLNAIGTPYTVVSIPSGSSFSFGDSNGRFLGRSWSYILRSSWEQENVSNPDAPRSMTSAQTTLQRSVLLYEIPSQAAMEGHNLQVVDSRVNGSLVGDSVALGPNLTRVNGTVTARNSVNWERSSIRVGDSLTPLGSKSEYDDAQFNQLVGQITTSKRPVTLLSQQSRVYYIPVGDRSPDSEGISAIYRRPADDSDWSVYAHPYYKTAVRVVGSGLNPAVPVNWATTEIRTASNLNTLSGRRNETVVNGTAMPFGAFTLKSHPTLGGPLLLLEIDVAAIPVVNGTRTLYIDLTTTDPTHARRRVGVTFKNASGIGSPVSIVSANPVYLTGTFEPGHPSSILAPSIQAGLDWTPARVFHSGQRQNGFTPNASTTDRVIPDGRGNAVSVQGYPTNIPLNPNALPPVTLLSWLVVVQ